MRLRLVLPDLPANARLLRRIVGLINADVIFLLHALHELFDQFIELAFRLQLLQPLSH